MRTVSPRWIGWVFSGVGSKWGLAGCSLTPTIGNSPLQSSPCSSKRRTMNCWTLVLGEPPAGADGLADLGEGLVLDALDLLPGPEVRLVARLVDHGLEGLDQVGRGDHLVAEAPHQLHRPGVDDRHVGDVVEGRVLHGDLPAGCRGSPGASAWSSRQDRYISFFAGEAVELGRLHPAHQPGRLPLGRDVVEPATAGELVRIEAEDVAGQPVPVVEVAEQPAVGPGLADLLLNPIEIHVNPPSIGLKPGMARTVPVHAPGSITPAGAPMSIPGTRRGCPAHPRSAGAGSPPEGHDGSADPPRPVPADAPGARRC